MVWMEPAGYSASVAPVFNDLDLLVVAFDGTSERTFYPNNLAAKDPDNTVEMVVIPDVDSYEWFNVRTRKKETEVCQLFVRNFTALRTPVQMPHPLNRIPLQYEKGACFTGHPFGVVMQPMKPKLASCPCQGAIFLYKEQQPDDDNNNKNNSERR